MLLLPYFGATRLCDDGSVSGSTDSPDTAVHSVAEESPDSSSPLLPPPASKIEKRSSVVAMRAKGDLIALVEAYPELKSDAHFLQLQDELIDTEDRIALAREFVNSSVTTYNIRVETLPVAIVARLTGHRKRPLLRDS